MSACEYLSWAQLFVLAVTAFLVWRYVRSTEEIKRAAIRQAALTGDQIEAMSRPVVVPRNIGNQLHLTNVGSGPALRVEWWLRPKSEPFAAPDRIDPDKRVDPDGEMDLIEAKGQRAMMGARDFPKVLGNNLKVICLYRSISGRTYLSQGVPREDPISGSWFDTETVEEKGR
jgi:hypothetical protein